LSWIKAVMVMEESDLLEPAMFEKTGTHPVAVAGLWPCRKNHHAGVGGHPSGSQI